MKLFEVSHVMIAFVVVSFVSLCASAAHPPIEADGFDHASNLSLGGGVLSTALVTQTNDRATTETSSIRTAHSVEEHDLAGPYFLRSAVPVETGEIELKFIYSYETSSGEEDEHEIEFEFEWGIAEEWEFILAVPAVIGNGAVEGNGDIEEIGFHTRLWHEDGWIPAFAVRNLFRLPTGYHSDGIDYTLRGLFSWTLVEDQWYVHFNPYGTVIGGNKEDGDEGEEEGDTRDFQWGAALGLEYRINDDVTFIVDYLHQSSKTKGHRNNHAMELGVDWQIAENQKLGFGTLIGLDGDGSGPNWIGSVSYILEIEP